MVATVSTTHIAGEDSPVSKLAGVQRAQIVVNTALESFLKMFWDGLGSRGGDGEVEDV